MKHLIYTLFLTLVLTACTPATLLAQPMDVSVVQEPGILFWLTLTDDVYSVWMRPTVTPEEPNLTLSIQVTFKVPHGEGDNRFEVNNLQSQVSGVLWAELSRVDSPDEEPSADYVSIEAGYIGGDRGAFGWQAGQHVEAFRFQNSGRCLGEVMLMANDDAFMPPAGGNNSASTNPGNYIRVVGLSESNAYIDNAEVALSANCDLRSDVRIQSMLVRSVQDTLSQQVQLLWQTAHEVDLLGFNLLRQVEDGDVERLNSSPIVAQQSGQPNSSYYQYTDDAIFADTTTSYLLELLLMNGETIQTPFGPMMNNLLHLPMIVR